MLVLRIGKGDTITHSGDGFSDKLSVSESDRILVFQAGIGELQILYLYLKNISLFKGQPDWMEQLIAEVLVDLAGIRDGLAQDVVHTQPEPEGEM